MAASQTAEQLPKPVPATPVSARRPRRKRGARTQRTRREIITAALFLAPILIALLLLRIYPAAQALVASLEQVDGSIGIGNYEFMFSSDRFRNVLQVTLVFNLLINPIQIVAALALALLFTQKLPATRLWRTIAFIPTAIPFAISAIVWRVAFRPDGPINAVLTEVGIPAQPFLLSEVQVLPSIILMASWVGVGYWMMFLIAGLNDVPSEYYEAAAIDGAGWWRRFWHITLPLLRRPLAFVLIADTVVNFLQFAPVQIMTGGGPEGASDLIMWSAYQQAFRFNDYPLAATHVVIVMLVMVLVVSLQFLMLRPKDTR